jgi:NAD(P)H-hydrate epimerase
MSAPSGPVGLNHWSLVGAETMRALDEATIKQLGVPGDVLMESAGRELAALVARETRGRVGVLCGPGNNGGDGLVAARQLVQAGREVDVALVTGGAELSAETARNLERYRALGREVSRGAPAEIRASVVIDALFGTGLRRPVDGDFAKAIEAAERSGAAVVAVDLPSGLDADTGQLLGAALRATRTLAIGLPKLALVLEPGRSYAGAVSVARIGILDQAPGATPDAVLWRSGAARAALPARPADGHKGHFGHVLLVAGSPGKTGAAALAAEGALRGGAGLATIACPHAVNAILEAKCTEAMTVGLAETEGGGLHTNALPDLRVLADERDVLCVGPGLGREAETGALVVRIAEEVALPLVLDADGLYPFARSLAALRARTAPTLLTPHPGEAARLLQCETAEVNRDRVAAARMLARESGCVVALKGAGTITASPEGALALNPTGGPVLASGGTGDVLAGLSAALFAQGLAPHDAATLAAWLHGAAGDRLAQRVGSSGVLASEIAAEIPVCMEALRHSEEPEERGLALPFP